MDIKLRGYLIRFTVLHVITYVLFGVIFYNLQNYESALVTQEYFQLFRPLSNPLVTMAPFIQIFRGGLLALFLYPFSKVFIEKKHGWLLLFALIFGFTAVASGRMLFDFIKALGPDISLSDFIVGVPEITVQILVFSWLFVKWERKKALIR